MVDVPHRAGYQSHLGEQAGTGFWRGRVPIMLLYHVWWIRGSQHGDPHGRAISRDSGWVGFQTTTDPLPAHQAQSLTPVMIVSASIHRLLRAFLPRRAAGRGYRGGGDTGLTAANRRGSLMAGTSSGCSRTIFPHKFNAAIVSTAKYALARAHRLVRLLATDGASTRAGAQSKISRRRSHTEGIEPGEASIALQPCLFSPLTGGLRKPGGVLISPRFRHLTGTDRGYAGTQGSACSQSRIYQLLPRLTATGRWW